MHLAYEKLIGFTEVSSYLWYLNREKIVYPEIEVLVLGDSQLLSGITTDTIAKRESISQTKVLFMVRPSEQPEGMLDQYLQLRGKLPHLRKLYINISPISISQNSVTAAHKQLYLSFGKLTLAQITNSNLRRAYFGNQSDIFWKSAVEVFPFFGLNQNFSSLFSIVPSSSQFYEDQVIGDSTSLKPNPSFEIAKRRLIESDFLKNHFSLQSHWTWKNFSEERAIDGNDIFPRGSSQVFLKKRELSSMILMELRELTSKEKVFVTCLDIPFSRALENDMKQNQVRELLNKEIIRFNWEETIHIPDSILNQDIFFTDFTHLNAKGRDVLRSYLLH